MWKVTTLFISILAKCTSHSTPSGIFAHENSYPPYFDEDASREQYLGGPSNVPFDVAAATVTYDKREFLGDMLRDYFSQKEYPPVSSTRSEPVVVNTTKPNMSGYGKIDISIQYGCCPNDQNDKQSETQIPQVEDQEILSDAVTEQPQQEQELIGEIVIHNNVDKKPTSRFRYPPREVLDYQEVERMYPVMYRSSNYRNYAEDAPDDSVSMRSNNNKRFYKKLEVTTTNRPQIFYSTMNPTKSYTNKRYNSYRYEEEVTTTPKPTTQMYKSKKDFYRYDPVLVAQEQFYTVESPGFMPTMPTVAPLGRGLPLQTERSSYYTSERLLPPLNLYSGYVGPQSAPNDYYQRGGPPENQPTTTQTPVTSGTPSSASSYSYFGNHVTPRSILQDISKIVIQDVPSRLLYTGQQMTEQTYNAPNQQQTKRQIPAVNNQNYYQSQQNNYQSPQNNNQQLQNDYQSQQNNQQLQNSYQSLQNNNQQPKNNYQQSQPSENQFSSNENAQRSNNNNYQPGLVYYDTEEYKPEPITQNKPTEKYSIQSNDPENLIKKNRQTFLKMQRQAYDFFTKAALNDFKTLLANSIKNKNVEILPEEKNMLETKIESNQEISANILDYLTVYERYSETLNNTELASHLLHDMDRAKEYLSMKLNKFWLELDAMENADEFQDKKSYYKNREKPTGIMNIFYDWYEKMITNPTLIDSDKIQLKLVEIMKKERRYWLLLLRN